MKIWSTHGRNAQNRNRLFLAPELRRSAARDAARLHAPAATPREIVNRLADVVINAARSADTRRRLLDLGAEPVGSTPDEAAQFLRDEVALWAAVVKASGARAD